MSRVSTCITLMVTVTLLGTAAYAIQGAMNIEKCISMRRGFRDRRAHILSGLRHFTFLVGLECGLESPLWCGTLISTCVPVHERVLPERTSGCLSMFAACDPTLALSIFAVTTPSKSIALSMPVAEYTSTSAGFPSSTSAGVLAPDAARPPPAAIAPGPAGLTTFGAAFFAPAFGGVFTLAGALASSSARMRAFSALRASSARRFSSLSSFGLAPFPPAAHFSASLRSCVAFIWP